MAKLTAYVKGDPKTNTLLDCPFCHRVLLTLETKEVPYESAYVDFNDKPQWCACPGAPAGLDMFT